MTRRLFQALCAFLVPALLLSGCWQGAPPEELALQPEEEEEEPRRFFLLFLDGKGAKPELRVRQARAFARCSRCFY